MAEFYQFAFLLSKMPSIFNEKQIEELTQLAKENVDFAPRIVKLIQDHLFASNKSRYFNPTFHLIENIAKNNEIGGVYGPLFSNKIASLFSSVFRTADKSTRRSMFTKRKEWLKLNVFPIDTLYTLDVEVKAIDPNWPAISRPSHAPPQPIVPVSPLPSSSNATTNERKRKIRFEDEGDQQVDSKKFRKDPDDMYRQGDSYFLLPAFDPTRPPPGYPSVATFDCTRPPPGYPFPAPVKGYYTAEPPSMVRQDKVEVAPAVKSEKEEREIDFKSACTKVRSNDTVRLLHDGQQCTQCGIRFPAEQRNDYGAHLDWHFQQNRIRKNDRKQFMNRAWYLSISDWVPRKAEEVSKEIDLNTNTTDQVKKEKIPLVVQGKTPEENTCFVCLEKLNHFFYREQDEWYLQDAVRVDGITFHRMCHLDYLSKSCKLE